MRLAAQRLIAQRADLAVRIESIRQRAHTDDPALLELSQTEEALAALDKQIARLEVDLAKLMIRAPAAGTDRAAAARSRTARASRMQLASWSGRPLDVRNVGAYLEASTLVCRIAQPGKLEAILAIDQEELDFVRAGQRVDLLLASLPGEKRPRPDRSHRRGEHGGGPDAAGRRPAANWRRGPTQGGIERPLSVVYQANVPLDDRHRPDRRRHHGPGPHPCRLSAALAAPVASRLPDISFRVVKHRLIVLGSKFKVENSALAELNFEPLPLQRSIRTRRMLIPYSTDAPIYHWPYATLGTIILNVLDLSGRDRRCRRGSRSMVYEHFIFHYGQWNPIQWMTSNYLHAGFLHVLGNMIVLWGIGIIIEGKVGWWRFLLVYNGIGMFQCGVEQTLMLFAEGRFAWGASAICMA